MSIGLVCPACDGLVGLNATDCPRCGHQIDDSGLAGAPRAPTGSGSAALANQMTMKTCPSCGHSVPHTDRFCGQCGNRMEDSASHFASAPPTPSTAGKTMFFSAGQIPGRAKLILVRGDSTDGISYQLNGTEHVAGREEGAILFPDDPLISPHHANFIYRDQRLFVRDEGSVNGVFIRIKQPANLESGGVFLVGEQLLQVEAVAPDLGPQPDSEGTYFYASPRRASKMKLIQRLRGGDIGLIYRARSEALVIGRENCDVNFPDDPFISGRHAEVGLGPDGNFVLRDLGSKNGTFVRIEQEVPLAHGDYVFLGQQLMRVEIS